MYKGKQCIQNQKKFFKNLLLQFVLISPDLSV